MYTIEELIDVISAELTVSCALPKALPDIEIRRIIENKTLPWFYQNYYYSVSQMYYHLDASAFQTDLFTQSRTIILPCEIQSISWIFPIRNLSLFSLGIGNVNLSVNLGTTNSPYLTSYVSTIGDIGVMKTLLENMSDMLNDFNKYTVKHHFNQMSHRLTLLGTNFTTTENMILECYANIESEAVFADPQFIKMTTGYAKQSLGRLYGRFDFTLPGGVKYNAGDLVSEGKEEVKEVEEYIKGMSNTGWFIMSKR